MLQDESLESMHDPIFSCLPSFERKTFIENLEELSRKREKCSGKQDCFPGEPPMMESAIRHTPAEQAPDWITGQLPPLPNYCGVFVDAPGGGRGSKGSGDLQL
jgi:hypothetical protein